MFKNKICLSITVVTILVLIAAVFSINTDNDIKNGKSYNPEDYILNLDYKDDFRILQLGDTHLGMKDNMDEHLDFIDLTIKDSNADLIVMSGDIFTYADKRVAKEFFDFIDSYGIPWTMTFGNHDEQCLYSVDWISSYLNNYGGNCLFIDHQDDDVFGNANFAINLMDGDSIHDQVIIMDSNRYNFGEYIGYDYMKPSQINWYSNIVNYTSDINNGTVNSIMFFHIPLPEFEIALNNAGGNDAQEAIKNNGGLRDLNSDNGLEMDSDYSAYTRSYSNDDSILEYGYNGEGNSIPKYNSGMFDKILELDSTKAIICSHDHANNSRLLYKGVYLCYGVNSTNRIYRDEDMMGGHVIVVHDDHSLSFEHIYHRYKELYND